jgi:hypothetical protein
VSQDSFIKFFQRKNLITECSIEENHFYKMSIFRDINKKETNIEELFNNIKNIFISELIN